MGNTIIITSAPTYIVRTPADVKTSRHSILLTLECNACLQLGFSKSAMLAGLTQFVGDSCCETHEWTGGKVRIGDRYGLCTASKQAR